MKFAFEELKDAEAEIVDEEDTEFSIKCIKKSKVLRLLVKYIPYDNNYDVEITDYLQPEDFTFMISKAPDSKLESYIPFEIWKHLRNKYFIG
ncbi:MAG: hypothetical protein ABIT08_13590 [Bacteroidia bacterium]